MSALSKKILDFLFIEIPQKLLKQHIVCNVFAREESRPRALIYFKTDPIFSKRLTESFVHTNNAEILKMAEVFDAFGYTVDLLDRGASWEEIESLKQKDYTIYLANAAGNSAPLHSRIINEFDIDTKIFFASGPEPEWSNQRVELFHNEFKERNNADCVVRRLVKGEAFDKRFKGIDAIFYIGHECCKKSYEKYNIPNYRIKPSCSPEISFSPDELKHRDPKRFLFFAGNGLICKGLDRVLEAFDGQFDLKLDVCGPPTEEDFWNFYKPLLERNPQINFHGFVDVGGELFHGITKRASFSIFPPSAEGCATSMIACMRRGCIPVTNHECGVNLKDFGLLMEDVSVEGVRKMALQVAQMDIKQIQDRAVGSYVESLNYDLAGYEKDLKKALLAVARMKEKKD